MFEFLFRKKAADRPMAHPAPRPGAEGAGANGAAPGTAIRFHPELVAQLKHEHQVLLTLFASIKKAFGEGKLASVVDDLDRFRAALQSHLLAENVRLYIYLEHQLAGDPPSHQMIHEFRHEMDGIGRAVVAFLGKYRNLSKEPALAQSFGADLDKVGAVLVDRIQREETTLYPLYLPGY